MALTLNVMNRILTNLVHVSSRFTDGWAIVIISLSVMWPFAMYTYKTVNRLRLYMMNKIINLEPCGDSTGLYGLNRLPKGTDNEYIISGGQGIWNYDEGSAISDKFSVGIYVQSTR